MNPTQTRSRPWHPLTLRDMKFISHTALGVMTSPRRKLFELACAAKYLLMVNQGKVVFSGR